MAMFSVRVELHGATWDDYEILHPAMEAAGFNRTIASDDGVVYHLPTAEYTMTAQINTARVLAKAKLAANSTGVPYTIWVNQSIGWMGSGLVPAG